MDIFIEYMVKKKKQAKDYLLTLLIAFAAALLMFVAFFGLLGVAPQFASIILLLVVGIGYGAYWLITSFNIEFEYSLVNDEIDVDKIINVKRRKRLTTVKIRGLEAFGKKSDGTMGNYLKDSSLERIYACRDINESDVYYAVYSEKDKRKIIFFNPSEKMVDAIKKLNPFKTMNLS